MTAAYVLPLAEKEFRRPRTTPRRREAGLLLYVAPYPTLGILQSVFFGQNRVYLGLFPHAEHESVLRIAIVFEPREIGIGYPCMDLVLKHIAGLHRPTIHTRQCR